ncbi:MAG: diaminopropionate ammonia-lyase [Alphaproteobacteria bacterium]|nr:diaminopropionate ammonia-lyase [Alphaproteobacteria bacterium]
MPHPGPAMRLFANPRLDRTNAYPAALKPILSLAAEAAARREIASWPGYAPTPLRALDWLARELGVAGVDFKEEQHRFGLRSFKALGGAYAVKKLARAANGAKLTVCCATDGNHGRSVAWGAREAGCACVIYVHEHVSEARAEAIRAYGAEVRRVAGNYDDSVRKAAADAAAAGWTVVSDTSWEGYTEIPKDVMQGYGVMVAEALEQGGVPTHVFVQGGVGGIAAATVAHLWERFGPQRPRVVVVEPDKADCLTRSAEAGRITQLTGDLDTIMAGLSCGEPSPLAWAILDPGADAFMAIGDDTIAPAMRALADHGVVGGESGVAGMAGLVAVAKDPAMRTTLRLDAGARVLLFGTEGGTDPALYEQLVGRDAEAVSRSRSP